MCQLIPRTEVEILDLVTKTEKVEVRVTLKRHFREDKTGQVKVNLTKKAFRQSLNAYVETREEIETILLLTGRLKATFLAE